MKVEEYACSSTFTKDDIRIFQWGKGNGFHFYAYVGDIEVKVGDGIKWETYEQAYKEALRYVFQSV